MRKYWFILTILVLPLSLTGNKLPPHLKFWRINEQYGLQVELVNDIKQGPLGFIWLATNDGLYRYDGLNFTVYRNNPADPQSLPYNYVSRLFFDSSNRLWVLTDHGIVRYNYATDKFERIPGTEKGDTMLIHSTNGIAQAGDGTLIISSYSQGIVCYKNGIVFPLNKNTEPFLAGENIMTILLQGDSLLWVGTSDNGLISYHLRSEKISHLTIDRNSGIYATAVYSLFEDSKMNLWVGTNNGLIVLPPGLKPYQVVKGKGSNLPDNKILSVFEDHKRRIWIGTGESGLLMVPLSQIMLQRERSVFKIYEASERLNTVSYRTINCIFEDKSKYIWLGTYNDGLNVFFPDGEEVTSYLHYPDVINSLPHNRVWGICEDYDGILWIGTDGNGISRLDPFTGNFRHYPYQNGSPGGPNDKAILTALCDRNNNLWFGTYNGGVSLFEREKQSFRHFFKNQDGSFVFARNDVRSLHESKDGTIWAGTNRGGLYRYSTVTGSFEPAGSQTELDIRSVISDSEGKLWLGTFGSGGLFSYDPHKDEFESHSLEADFLNATPVIFSICITSDSILWLGSQYFGLIRFNINSKEKKIFNQPTGLAHNTVKAIVSENDTTIWLSTDAGISSFNIYNEKFNNYNAGDGFLPGLFNDNSCLISTHGYLAFGGDNGLNLFYPDNLKTSEIAFPTIEFIGFKLFNMALTPGTEIKNNPLKQSIWIQDTILLKYNQNVFTLDFVAREYPFSTGWHYEFIMEGYDENWNKVRDQTSATYRNLPPGDYIFKVRAMGKSDISHGPERTIIFIVKPPWWRTIWAYSTFVLLLGFVSWLVIGYQIRQLKLKNSLYYEKMLRQKEHALTQEKLRFYTNFSHEMRTPLSLILGPSNDLHNQNPRPDQLTRIEVIRRNAYYLLELLNKLLEFRKVESNKLTLNVSCSDIGALIAQEIEFFEFQARQKDILLIHELQGETKGWADFSSLQIILNNLLSNAIKFTPAGGLISLHSVNQNGRLNLVVENTGEGISGKDIGEIFNRFFQGKNSAGHGGTGIGLALCKNLVELHNGDITAESSPGEKTRFVASIPVTKENYLSMPHARFIDNTLTPGINVPDRNFDTVHHNEEISDDKKLVLLVDDNYDLIVYLHSILSPRYRIISAGNGKSGIELARKHIPDLIISDVMMPEKSGVELCQELKTDIRTSHIPIILLTAKHSNEARIEGYEKGADCYIVKPFDSAVLLSQINGLFQNRIILRDFFKRNYLVVPNDQNLSYEEEFLLKIEKCLIGMYEKGMDMSVPELCRELGFSRTSLYRKVKAISDMSINQIIKSLKLRISADLIRQKNDMTISQIAFELGFNDIKYFRECFIEHFGMTPSLYKKKAE